ncbi:MULTISPECIES: DegT/DnrJ/EryC1/StrS family aminotransferase [Streptomyces]|uniref:DegT/DnrJ/EryC1/StrS family aminotransferase n=1 Tax=Streptomyces katrae TaxID=68223 RepID=A0ABT7GPH3_9ACTN|nr:MULTISPECIES: DegT/DnrJ/EryC1/StrS family aminotransferase [Streptomyces]MDK9495373.1 DegT/DnrJ/EryC1/StrS family aminotransferase [Streptomyces katrae]RST05392.1 hypothetical protein EF910_13240 [Streptomyces sp. WAC07149]GLX23083.1 hypothetical protein Slala01_67270 [Streptomyces lavendulae subsp. lavendulae]GLX30545.1 hypothetical protein Slala02_63650 [Streptomyces lavendulae subsp. lavendulae]
MINLFPPRAGADEKAFEAAFGEHPRVAPEHAVFVHAAASGMSLAAEALGLQDGDEVVLPSFSYLTAAGAVLAHGGRPVFCDVDPRTLNPTWEGIEAAVTERTRAVVAPHHGGHPGDIERIAARCRELGIVLIEDAARRGSPVGSVR